MSRLLRAVPAAALLVLLAVAASASPASAKTTWLCKPGLAKNPCVTDLTGTLLNPDGTVIGPAPAAAPTKRPVDCFYV